MERGSPKKKKKQAHQGITLNSKVKTRWLIDIVQVT